MNLSQIAARAAIHGLALRGAFHTDPHDEIFVDAISTPAGTIVPLGFAGRRGWPIFAASAEMADGRADPLDRWSRRIVEGLAAETGGSALFPFDGPPWHPFQAWAQRGDAVTPSPIGLLIDPVFGLWHSYRGALAFAEPLDLPQRLPAPSPCASCAGKPCLSACPVGAFRPDGYNVAACRAHLSSEAGAPCLGGGCLARRACPVGRDHAYGVDQTAFLMRAFRCAGPT
ncbi:MAG TPA: ferredoxin [Lichenihabitans sp.]|nr:ferredoxin [Lichenihabitans sp.]